MFPTPTSLPRESNPTGNPRRTFRALALLAFLGAQGFFSSWAHAASESAQASEGGGQVHVVNWYKQLGLIIFGDAASADYWWPVVGSSFILIVITLLGMAAGLHRLQPETLSDEEILPPKRFSPRAFVELCWAVISSTLESVIGERWYRFVPILGGTFFFIIIMNLSGIVPGFTPATEQLNMTLGIAIVIFLAFNYYGLKYAGADYLKHLAGPFLPLALIMIPIEVISLFARPVSLSLRLFGNISGDHLVFSVFSTLMRDFGIPWLPVPAALLGFGTLVACLQAFIFMTLSAVYVKLAIETAHSDHH